MWCSIDGEVTTNLTSDETWGWVHHSDSWHTLEGTMLVKKGDTFEADGQTLPNGVADVDPNVDLS